MPYQGRIPDRYGDWGSFDGCVSQTAVRRERSRAPTQPPPPAVLAEPKPPHSESVGGAFKPNSTRGLTTFHKFPVYVPDPLDAKIDAARKRAAEQRAKMTSVSGKPFKPTPHDLEYRLFKDSTPAFIPKATTSIIFHSRNLGR